MQGQTRLEFIFGVIIFAIIILYIVTQINNTFSTMINNYDVDTSKAKATNIIKIILENITDKPYVVSKNKVYDLSQNCDDLNTLDLGTYRLKIYNSSNLLLFCGTDSLKPPKIFVSKYISFVDESDLGNVTLEVW